MTSRSRNPLRAVFLWSLCLCCTSLLAASTALPSGASTSDGSSSSSAINKPRTIGPGSSTSFDFAPRVPTPSLLPDDYKKLIPAWVKCSEITGNAICMHVLFPLLLFFSFIQCRHVHFHKRNAWFWVSSIAYAHSNLHTGCLCKYNKWQKSI